MISNLFWKMSQKCDQFSYEGFFWIFWCLLIFGPGWSPPTTTPTRIPGVNVKVAFQGKNIWSKCSSMIVYDFLLKNRKMVLKWLRRVAFRKKIRYIVYEQYEYLQLFTIQSSSHQMNLHLFTHSLNALYMIVHVFGNVFQNSQKIVNMHDSPLCVIDISSPPRRYRGHSISWGESPLPVPGDFPLVHVAACGLYLWSKKGNHVTMIHNLAN